MILAKMAAILEMVLQENISVKEVIKWLTNDDKEESPLSALVSLRPEFIPYFLNFLRDQTLHLLQGGRSTTNTPAKTPGMKYKQPQTTTTPWSANSSKRGSGNRVQLFTSPMDATQKLCESFLESPSDVGSSSFKRHAGGGRKSTGSRCSPQFDGTPRGRSQNYQTTPESHRQQRQRHNLSDYFVTPDMEHRKKKSPLSGRRDELSPSPHVTRKSGGRGKKGQSSEKKGNRSVTEKGDPPVFSLNNMADFPTLGDKDTESLPKGAKMITPSRRVKTTLLPANDNGANTQVNAAFSDSVILPSPAGNKGRSSSSRGSLPPSPLCGTPSLNKSSIISPRTRSVLISPAAGSGTRKLDDLNISSESHMLDSFSPVLRNKAAALHEERQQLKQKRLQQRLDSTDVEKQEARTTPGIPEVAEASPHKKCTTNQHPVAQITPVKTLTCSDNAAGMITPTKSLLERLSSLVDITSATPSEVTYKCQLSRLSELFAECLLNHLVPNLSVELYFVMQLLTSRGSDADLLSPVLKDSPEANYFVTVHNAVYFSISVINSLKSLVQLLDPSFLRLLSDNPRIIDFCPELKEQLVTESNRSRKDLPSECPSEEMSHEVCAQAKSKEIAILTCKANLRQYLLNLQSLLQSSICSPMGGVSFQVDTDNRKNFPSERTFHRFKKQRDLFYELLREWDDHHMSPGWSMLDAQASRIYSLVNYQSELATHIHLTRLFQSQLLQTCQGDNSYKSDGDEENITLLSQLKQTNPEKFKRLQSRFITPASSGGPCPQPAFPGYQEFFRNFIMAAGSAIFNQHLSDGIAAKLSEMNETSFNQEMADEETLDTEEQQTFCSHLLVSRLLAKFFGFLVFHPYQCLEPLPENLLPSVTAMRNQVRPSLDVSGLLQKAYNTGRLVVTVPWVVEYLSMADMAACCVDYYSYMFSFLKHIYRDLSHTFVQNGNISAMFILTLLGWLFGLPMFPEGFFFQDVPPNICREEHPPDGCVDKRNLVDQEILYVCCPYLNEMRSLLVDFAVGLSSRNSTIRKITPITADRSTAPSLSQKQLQNHLEESFFHNHPASLKRTVEFVGDRVGSNFIKNFRTNTFPAKLASGQKIVTEMATQIANQSISSLAMSKATQQIQETSANLVMDITNVTSKESQKYCPEKASAILPGLLPEDTSSQVMTVCSQVATKIAEEKVQGWLHQHISINMFRRELTSEFEKLLRQSKIQSQVTGKPTQTETCSQDPEKQLKEDSEVEKEVVKESEIPANPTVKHNLPSVESQKLENSSEQRDDIFPSDALIQIKSIVKRCMLGTSTVNTEEIITALADIEHSLSNAKEMLLPSICKTLAFVTVHLSSVIVFQKPHIWSSELKCSLFKLWQGALSQYVNFNQLMGAHNLLVLQGSQDNKLSWRLFSELTHELLMSDLLSLTVVVDNSNMIITTITEKSLLCGFAAWLCALMKSLHSQTLKTFKMHIFLEPFLALSDMAVISKNVNKKVQQCVDLLLSTINISESSAGVGLNSDTSKIRPAKSHCQKSGNEMEDKTVFSDDKICDKSDVTDSSGMCSELTDVVQTTFVIETEDDKENNSSICNMCNTRDKQAPHIVNCVCKQTVKHLRYSPVKTDSVT